MSTITKQAVQAVADLKAGYTLGHADVAILNELARIALASLEAEPVCVIDQSNLDYLKSGSDADVWPASRTEMGDVLLYRAAPPAPVSMKDHQIRELVNELRDIAVEYHGTQQLRQRIARTVRDAMLQGADSELQRKAAIHDALCEKYSVESLADFVDWQRNHITELEAAPPAPVGPGEPAVMPDYPGYVMTQRECFQAGAKRAVPDGWVVVPIEPTMEILDEFDSIIDYGAEDSKDAWGRLIAAAPRQEVKP